MDVYVAWGMLSLWGFYRCRKCVNMYTLSLERERCCCIYTFLLPAVEPRQDKTRRRWAPCRRAVPGSLSC